MAVFLMGAGLTVILAPGLLALVTGATASTQSARSKLGDPMALRLYVASCQLFLGPGLVLAGLAVGNGVAPVVYLVPGALIFAGLAAAVLASRRA